MKEEHVKKKGNSTGKNHIRHWVRTNSELAQSDGKLGLNVGEKFHGLLSLAVQLFGFFFVYNKLIMTQSVQGKVQVGLQEIGSDPPYLPGIKVLDYQAGKKNQLLGG